MLTVLGGVGPSAAGADLVEGGEVDVIVHGEGEVAFSKLLVSFRQVGRCGFGNVPGISFLNSSGRCVATPPADPLYNLDALPLPARDMVDMRLYRRVSRGRAGNIVASRGCSYACSYCYSRHHWGRGQRRFGVERVAREVWSMVSDHGVDRIRFEDDDLTENAAWIGELCRRFGATDLPERAEWEGKGRPEHLTPELLGVLRRAGCFRIMMGVETIDESLLRTLDRPMSVATIERAIASAHEAGIAIQATLILGIPGETDRAMRRTLEWLHERLTGPRDIISPCFFVPFFGAVKRAMSSGSRFHVEVTDRDAYTGHIPVVSSDACSLEELWRLYDDLTPTRHRGLFRRVAKLAPWDEVQHRLEAAGSH